MKFKEKLKITLNKWIKDREQEIEKIKTNEVDTIFIKKDIPFFEGNINGYKNVLERFTPQDKEALEVKDVK